MVNSLLPFLLVSKNIQRMAEWVRTVGSRGKNLEIEMGRKKSLQVGKKGLVRFRHGYLIFCQESFGFGELEGYISK